MPVNVGVNHYDPDNRKYPVPTTFIQPIYTHPSWAGGNTHPEYWQQEIDGKIKPLREAGHYVVLKIKYTQNQDAPHGEDQLEGYCYGISVLARMLGGGIGLCFGNEPNFDVEAEWAAHITHSGYMAVPYDIAWMFDYWLTPAAPWHPKYGSMHVEGIEPSPWARYQYTYWKKLEEYRRLWTGVLIHTYADCGADGNLNGGAQEPFADPRESHGWRWGTNTLDTWRECLEQTDLRELPVIVAEYNSRTHGAVSSNSYPQGLLQNAVQRFEYTFGDRAKALCWFLDHHYDVPGSIWEDEALKFGKGRMALARADIESMWGV